MSLLYHRSLRRKFTTSAIKLSFPILGECKQKAMQLYYCMHGVAQGAACAYKTSLGLLFSMSPSSSSLPLPHLPHPTRRAEQSKDKQGAYPIGPLCGTPGLTVSSISGRHTSSFAAYDVRRLYPSCRRTGVKWVQPCCQSTVG